MAQSKITPPVKKSKMRSSPEARRLIRAYIKHYKTQRQAANALHMTQAQLCGLLNGRLKDTSAIKVALDRADARARKAWLKVDHDHCTVIDAPATLHAALRALQQANAMIETLVRVSEVKI